MKKTKFIIHGRPVTPREIDFMPFMILGRTIRAIAFEFDLADSTVKAIMHNFYLKFDLHNRSDVIAWALKTCWDIDGGFHPERLDLSN